MSEDGELKIVGQNAPDDLPYTVINHCRWDKLSDILPSLVFRLGELREEQHSGDARLCSIAWPDPVCRSGLLGGGAESVEYKLGGNAKMV